jgi:hypothetical protein
MRGLRVLACLGTAMLLSLGALSAPAGAATSTLRPASGPAGTVVSLVGRGFGARQRVVLKAGLSHRTVARVKTRRGGAFKASFTIFPGVQGTIQIVSRTRHRQIVNYFHVSGAPDDPQATELASSRGTRLRWAPPGDSAGARLGLRGSQFPHRKAVRVRFGDQVLRAGKTDSRGSFSSHILVPTTTTGRHTVRVRVGPQRLRFGFIVSDDPVIAAAGDIACDPESMFYNGGAGAPGNCQMRATSEAVLRANPTRVLALGDNQYEGGTRADYLISYEPTWGRFKSMTKPVPGNHEYGSRSATGYFDYWDGVGRQKGPAGDRSKGYYSFDIGSWHVIALNSNCSELNVNCGVGFAQEAWLRADLSAHPRRCVLAFWHHPWFTSGQEGSSPTLRDFVNALYEHRADVLLVGHDHDNERYAPQTPDGRLDLASGIREFVVGTGGRDLVSFKKQPKPNSEVQSADTFGILVMHLHPSSYDWQFVPAAGGSFHDSGSQACH